MHDGHITLLWVAIKCWHSLGRSTFIYKLYGYVPLCEEYDFQVG